LLEDFLISAGRDEIGWSWHTTHVGVCTSGSSLIKVRGDMGHTSYVAQAGSVCIFPRRSGRTNIYHSGGGVRFTVLELDSRCLHRLLRDDGEEVTSALTPQIGIDDPPLTALVASMRTEVEQGCPGGPLYGESLSLALAAYLSAHYAAPRAERLQQRFTREQIRLVLDFIHAHLGENLSLVELADLLDLSPHYFSLLFKNTFGVSPHHYLLRERVTESRRLLATQRMSVSEVAMTLGFTDQSHFTQVFRKITGTTPKRYQRSC